VFTWIDGHLIVALFMSHVLAFVLIGLSNARLRRRIAKRQQIFGGAR
jgi:hypothetical protein